MPSSCYQVKLTNHITQWPSEQLSSLPWYSDICHDLWSVHHLSMPVLVIGEIDLSSRQSSCVAMQCTWCKYFLLYTSSAIVIECYPPPPPPPPRPPCYPGDWPVNWNQPSSVVETTEERLTEDRGHQVEGGFHWHAIDHEYQQTKHSIPLFFLKRIELWTW